MTPTKTFVAASLSAGLVLAMAPEASAAKKFITIGTGGPTGVYFVVGNAMCRMIHKEAAEGRLKGVLGYNEAPLVSIDFNHNPASSSFDATQTQVMGGNFVRVLSWYDNEWGFSNRMSDTAVVLSNAK